MIVVGDRASLLITQSELNGTVSRTISAERGTERAQRCTRAPRLTDRMSSGAYSLGPGAPTVDICPYDHSVNFQIEQVQVAIVGMHQDFSNG
jgi:hypothetical protein